MPGERRGQEACIDHFVADTARPKRHTAPALREDEPQEAHRIQLDRSVAAVAASYSLVVEIRGQCEPVAEGYTGQHCIAAGKAVGDQQPGTAVGIAAEGYTQQLAE